MIHQLEAAAIERDVVIAEGSETAEFLHGQLSQDITALAVGQSAWSLLLEPQGKTVALLRVTRTDDQRFLLDVDTGWGEVVVERLERFKLRTDCAFVLERWPGIAWRGPGAADVEADAPIVAQAGWEAIEGTDVIGPDVEAQPTISSEQYQSLRVSARWPAMGSELDESTIPAAARILDVAVDFTKGCYTGQELVARIDSRGGNTPTRLVRVRADHDDDRLPVGADVVVDGAKVATITSASAVSSVALAYLKRGVEVPTAAEVVVDEGARRTPVALLP